MDDLREFLRKKLEDHDHRDLEIDGVKAAVLIPILPSDSGPEILFVRKSNDLKHHAGQISFPGGRYDDVLDNRLLETALREAQEEANIPDEMVEVLGRMDEHWTYSTNYLITPYVAISRERIPNLKPDDREIVELISVPLERFRNPEIRIVKSWDYKGEEVPITFYNVEEDIVIWGATARILDQFFQLLKGWE